MSVAQELGLAFVVLVLGSILSVYGRLAQEYRLVIIGLAIIVAVSLDRLSTYLRGRRRGAH